MQLMKEVEKPIIDFKESQKKERKEVCCADILPSLDVCINLCCPFVHLCIL